MSDVPKTYQEEISSLHSHKWQKAMNKWQKVMEEKMHALRENDTFELTFVPENNTNAISSEIQSNSTLDGCKNSVFTRTH